MLANTITLLRMPLLVVIIFLLYQPSAPLRILAAFLNILLIIMDSLDGYVARSRGEASVLGSILDIAADRTVEFVLWVVYADLDVIPIILPLIVLARGVFVDAIRAVAPAKGLAPFDLMRSEVSRFVVKSPLFRGSYAVVKGFAFFFLALALGLATIQHALTDPVTIFAQICAWLSLAFCLVRGLPVLIEAPRVLQD